MIKKGSEKSTRWYWNRLMKKSKVELKMDY